MRCLFFGSLAVFSLVLGGAVFANETAQSNEELLRRLAALENSNARLEKENASLRSQVRHRENSKHIALTKPNGRSLPVSAAAPASHAANGAYASAPIDAFSWTGFYVGLQAGYGWHRNSYTYTGTFPGVSVFNTDGFVGGGAVGYNWQTGPVVFGLEGDLSYANLNSSGVFTELRPCLPGATGCSANLNWFGTGRARLGYAGGALLTFVTGGAAVGRVQGSTIAAACGTPTCAFDETRWGWTAGAGVEWNFNATWSAKVEYLYIDLGTPSFTAAPVTTSDLTYNVVRGGVNLHF